MLDSLNSASWGACGVLQKEYLSEKSDVRGSGRSGSSKAVVGGSVDLIPRDNRKDSCSWNRLVQGIKQGFWIDSGTFFRWLSWNRVWSGCQGNITEWSNWQRLSLQDYTIVGKVVVGYTVIV